MRIYLHIGPDAQHSERLQAILEDKRDQLAGKGVLFPRAPGNRNHTRLFMAATPANRPDLLRANRGFGSPEAQARLREELLASLSEEIKKSSPDKLILSASQFGSSLFDPAARDALATFLRRLSDDIVVVAHVEDQARMLVRHIALQVSDGRTTDFAAELALCGAQDWWKAAVAAAPGHAPDQSLFSEIQIPAYWLDYVALVRFWDAGFGEGATRLRALDASLWTEAGTEEIRASFDIEATIGKAAPERRTRPPSAAFLTRAAQFNALFLRLAAKERLFLPRMMLRRALGELMVGGDRTDPGSLHAISARFAADNAGLVAAHPGLDPAAMAPDAPAAGWTPADPGFGFRATQYLATFAPRLREACSETATEAPAPPVAEPAAATPGKPGRQKALTPVAERLMPARAKENFDRLRQSSFAPHNLIGRVNEEELAAAFTAVPPRALPEGSSGNVIVGCMKNEAPYIVEWVAYHRAIGVDNFLIYTNGCEDGTSEILDRLDAMGIVNHRNNDDWKGNSPQQFALDRALEEPVIENAEWIIHIDVDEFINVRCDNGTLQDFFDRVPDATNVAMTWRLFGHSGVTRLEDRFVIDQFDHCAPKFCPKPHTVWGFKTMFRNIGAYGKLSCHRPNKLDAAFENKVRWVNGSGQDMTGEVLKNGWRNSKRSIGYDLLQLNHYALRSAESFLIKRQRGRALHVDRSIGLNYWIRMDWTGARDITIKRNVPRLKAEYDRLMQDETLSRLHAEGLAWHRAKADELHANPEFEELYQKALEIKLTETERVAYALALDMES